MTVGPPRTFRTTFEALGNQDYRWLWLGRLATSATFQMGGVAQGWLVYQLTGSAFALGWVGSGWSIATLALSPYGGVIADRVDKRTLMLWSRMGMLLNSFIIGLLISLGLIQIWHLAVSSFFTGVFIAFLMPAQQSIITELVDKRILMNAFAVDALGMGLMGVFSASVAGLVINAVGVQGVYYLMAAMYVVAVFTIVQLPKAPPKEGEPTSVMADLKMGARYLLSHKAILTILALGLVRVFFVIPYMTLMPAFAQDNLGFDAAGLGLLQSVAGVGALGASLLACYVGDIKGKGKMLVIGSIALGLSLMLYVNVRWLPGVFFFLALVGGFNNLYMVLSNTLLLSHTDPAYRGRVSSIAMMEFGLHPLGTIPSGAIADRIGVSWVVGTQGAIVAAIFLLVALFRPEVRRMD